MELQSVLPELESAGYALYAVSYDRVAALAAFATKYGITYPLLSDPSSEAITALGLLNAEAPPAIAGIPHPGVFVLDADGSIAAKRFYPSYRERDTGPGVLAHLLGIETPPAGPAQAASAGGVEVRVGLDAPAYAWGQRIWLTVEFAIAQGQHVYVDPTPDGYVPLSVEIDPIERVVVGAPDYPSGRSLTLPGLDERFSVAEGTARVSVPVTFMVVDAGELTVRGRVRFQACSDSECFPPQTVEFALPIAERPLIERPQRPA